MSAIGMRPVPTWKSTDAAPTPIRAGAICAPSAFNPWHEEQPLRNICRPSSICTERSAEVVSADVVALATLKVAPTVSNAKKSRSGAAALCRR